MSIAGEPPVGDPVEVLSQFLEDVENLVSSVVERPSGLFPDDHVARLVLAWRVVQPQFGRIRQDLPSMRDVLTAAGLDGPELDLKVELARWLIERFRSAWRGVRIRPPGKAPKKVARDLSGALGIVGLILGSLPTIVGLEQVKELIGALEKAAAAIAGMTERRKPRARDVSAEEFVSREPLFPLPATARVPRTLRGPTGREQERFVVIAYSSALFSVYRAIVDRLRPYEAFRMETKFGAYEMTADDFRSAFPRIVASTSYREGPPSAPGTCYYVVGPPPPAAATFLRPETIRVDRSRGRIVR